MLGLIGVASCGATTRVLGEHDGTPFDHTARVIMRGHALMQNIRRGHYELGIDARAHRRVAHAFTELSRTI